MKLLAPLLAACLLAVAAVPATADDAVIDLDNAAASSSAASEVAPPLPPPAATRTLKCADGALFTCLANSSHCVENSKVYCEFSVDLIKDISKY
jgi:hypothetical protein